MFAPVTPFSFNENDSNQRFNFNFSSKNQTNQDTSKNVFANRKRVAVPSRGNISSNGNKSIGKSRGGTKSNQCQSGVIVSMYDKIIYT